MRAKKYLEQQAKQDKKDILEKDNGEFLRVLESMVVPDPKKKRALLTRWIAAGASIAVAVILIVCFAVFYPFHKKVEYFDVNLDQIESNYEELQKDVKEFKLEINDTENSVSISKTFDKISGDVLFYTTTLDNLDTTLHLEIAIVCNPNYKYKDFSYNNQTKNAVLPNYSITYSTVITENEEFGFNMLSAKASIKKGKEWVYVTKYSQMLLTPESSFLKTIQDIII